MGFVAYVMYFHLMYNGGDILKLRFTYNLIDQDGKGFFTKEELKGLIKT
jgi:hypothetical protein